MKQVMATDFNGDVYPAYEVLYKGKRLLIDKQLAEDAGPGFIEAEVRNFQRLVDKGADQ